MADEYSITLVEEPLNVVCALQEASDGAPGADGFTPILRATGTAIEADSGEGFQTLIELAELPFVPVSDDSITVTASGPMQLEGDTVEVIANAVTLPTTTVGGDLNVNGISGFTDAAHFYGQVELANQVASTSQSALTRRLDMLEKFMNIQVISPPSGWQVLASTGTGAAMALSGANCRIDAANTSGFGAITVQNSGEVSLGPWWSSAQFGWINFSKPIAFVLRIGSAGQHDASVQSWAITIGGLDAAPTAVMSTMYPTNTVSTTRGYICLRCINGAVSLVTQTGNGTVITSATLDTISGVTNFGRQYTLFVEGGTLSLYKERAFLGSISGAPPGGVLGAASGVWFHHSATAASPSTQRRLCLFSFGAAWE